MAETLDPTRRRVRPTPPGALLRGSWLAIKLGVEPRVLDARRRAGELLAVPEEHGDDHLYPMWQFAPDGTVLPAVTHVLSVARAAGVSEEELYALLGRRHMTGGGRLLDALREGRVEPVLTAINGAARR
ncbi:MAG TPA: hypothetical protein VFO88_07865 [Gaiellaceae bacterium]|nr:hypothetical protein [Gaiellaceae bacterium]